VVKVNASESMRISPAPDTQGRPMPRATTAAWLVMPPRAVTMACGGMHAVNVFRAGFNAHQDDFLALGGARFGFVRVKHDRARGGAGDAGRPLASMSRV
jgi:hypothetical protein